MNLLQHILVFAIRVYRWTISPAQTFLFGPSGGCRFTPTCSEYALAAVHTHGAIAGGWLATKRICRCHPWVEGGPDPVPEREFGVRPSAPRINAAGIETCRAGAEGGSSSTLRSRATAPVLRSITAEGGEDGEFGI